MINSKALFLIILGIWPVQAIADDVPVVAGGTTLANACDPTGEVVGLDPHGDGFLSVQSGPGGRPFHRIDRVFNGQPLAICERRGPWLGVVYGSGNEDCRLGSPRAIRQAYTGPCRSGWVYQNYVSIFKGTGNQPSAPKPLPAEVQSSIDEVLKDCRDKPTFSTGFMTRRDINGDGIEDFILDFGHFVCGEAATLYCGSAGCATSVFASVDRGHYVKVLDQNVQSLKFGTVEGRPTMFLGLHGSECGKTGAEACGETLYWNGSNFSPAH